MKSLKICLSKEQKIEQAIHTMRVQQRKDDIRDNEAFARLETPPIPHYKPVEIIKKTGWLVFFKTQLEQFRP